MSRLAISALFTFFYSISLFASCPMGGEKIMKMQEQKQKAKYEDEWQEIVLLDLKSKQKEKRSLRRSSLQDGQDKKAMMNFTGPKEIKGSALLNWSDNSSENQWLYIPAMKKLQRIASGSKRKYFMGTDFTYADLEGENLKDNNYKCQKIVKCAKKRQCYLISSLPKSKSVQRKTGYKKRVLYIDTKNYVTHQIKYTNLRGKHFKTAKYMKWVKKAGIWRPNLAVMDQHNIHKTFIKIKKRTINQTIKPLIFTKRYLEKEMHIQ